MQRIYIANKDQDQIAPNGQAWASYVKGHTGAELLAIIHSTSPQGRYGLGRIAAMDEWDRRQPVCGSDRAGGTTDADIEQRERDNIANTGDC